MGRRRYVPPFSVDITHLHHRGVGVGTHEGQGEKGEKYAGCEVRVRAAPPGSRVQVHPFRRKRRVIHARRVGTERLPPEAIPPRCEVFGQCGGCALQELPLSVQQQHKHRLALRSLGDLAGVTVHPIRGTDRAYGYRNKVELTFGPRRYLTDAEMAAGVPMGGRFLGFHAPGRFDRVVDTARCELISEPLNALLATVRRHYAKSAFEPWNPRAHTGIWRHLLLRETTLGERLVVVFTAPPEQPEALHAELEALAEDLVTGADLPPTGIAWYVNPRLADTAAGEQRAVLRGRPWIEEELAGRRFRISPTAFFQTHTAGAEVLVHTVAEALGPAPRLLDLYCGAGTFALALADRFPEVLGVEANPEAVADARANAIRNGVQGTRFACGELENLLRQGELAGTPVGDAAVVVDPPRAGLHPRVARWLAALPARRLVYVACHAPSLKRDRHLLEEGGWRATSLWTVDLFPQTGHVEAVVRFDRTGPPPGPPDSPPITGNRAWPTETG